MLADSRRVLLGLAAALVLSGCVGLPTDNDIRVQGPAPADNEQPVRVTVVPPGPVPGMTPVQVVRGFLRAQSNPDDRHAIARRFLAPARAAAWNDAGPVVVYDSVTSLTEGTPVVATLSTLARIAPDGGYSVESSQQIDRYALTRVQGEWRLTDVPDGLRLTLADVPRSFTSVSTFFLTPAGGTLVPDPLFLPLADAGLPERLARSLVAGPSSWLRPAVRTAVPAGTRLLSARLEDGVLTVDLSPEILQAPSDQVARMSAQFAWTFAQLAGRPGVLFTVEGRPLPQPGAERVQGRDDWLSYDPDVLAAGASGYFVAADGRLRILGNPAVLPGDAGSGRLLLRHPAVSLRGDLLAGVRDEVDGRRRTGRQELLVGPLRERVATRRVADLLTAPSWGANTRGVWVVATTGRPAAQKVLVVPAVAGEAVREVRVDRLATIGRILALEVSRDGTRVAVISQGDDGRQVRVGRVVEAGAELRVEELRPVAPALLTASDLSWAGGDRLVVLAKSSADSVLPWRVAVDGSRVEAVVNGGLVGQPTRVAAAPDNALLVETDGVVWRAGPVLWASVARGSAPTFPG